MISRDAMVGYGIFRNNFKVTLDICNPMNDISTEKSGVRNGAARKSGDSPRRDPLDKRQSMAKLVREFRNKDEAYHKAFFEKEA
jgi:hypothetical protein